MPESRLPGGVTLSFPDSLNLAPVTQVENVIRGGSIPLPRGPIPVAPKSSSSDASDLLTALAAQDLAVSDQFELLPTAETQVRNRELPATPNPAIRVETNAADNEGAVVLTEHDGVYSWHFAVPEVGAASTRRALPGPRVLRFDIELTQSAGGPAQTRNWIVDLAIGGIRGWVLKFAAKQTVGKAVEMLDRNARTGFVYIDEDDAQTWPFNSSPGAVSLPPDRAGRVLLFIHGTFSSTVGGYGPLTATPWGRQFLAAAKASYDLVIGYDHPTLRLTPRENAAQLLELLERVIPQTAVIDVITHSRGGLVFRSLSELLMPSSQWKINIGRVIFVAVPNAGTLLAEPQNWSALINLYTNVAVGTCRLLSLMPQVATVSKILQEILKSGGDFLKYLSEYATAEGGVPGLEAMRPSGEFVKQLNETNPGQPGPGVLALYAISSEFKPTLNVDGVSGSGLPARLLQVLGGASIDQLMREANDLVVNTLSMDAVDSDEGKFITDEFRFGQTGDVYHTTYFIRPETVNAMTGWLRLSPPAKATPLVPSPQRGGAVPIVGANIPAAVDTNISVFDANSPVKTTAEIVRAFIPNYAVIEFREAQKQASYAYRSKELLDLLQNCSPEQSLDQVLNLRELQSSLVQRMGSADRTGSPSALGDTMAARRVVKVGGLTVGVLPAGPDYTPTAALPDIARTILAESSAPAPAAIPAATGIMPTFGNRTGRGAGAAPFVGSIAVAPAPAVPKQEVSAPTTVKPSTTDLYFLAQFPCEVSVGSVCTLQVTLSKQEIASVAGKLSAAGKAQGEVDRKLTIQIIPRAQFSVEYDREEVDLAQLPQQAEFYFDLKATSEGEGLIWVVFRQGPSPICTLELQPKVVAGKAAGGRPLQAEAPAGQPQTVEGPVHQLRIMSLQDGNDTRYRYELYSPALRLLKEFKSERINDPAGAFVNRLYKEIEDRWISNADDIDAFAAEMQAYGADLFTELMPLELRQILWDHRDEIKSIFVLSTEPFIPWEMVLVKDPAAPALGKDSRYLAEMGLVRWLYEAAWPPTELRIRKGRAYYVIPHYPLAQYQLPSAAQEEADLKQLFDAAPVTPQPKPVRDLLGQKSFDLLHFACHAGADEQDISKGKILLEGRIEGNGTSASFIPATIDASLIKLYADLEQPDGTRPIVVLNACQGARSGLHLSSTGGFAQSFLQKGAGAFIGALWSVGDSPARTFTVEIYKQLLGRAKLADAVVAARRAARDAGDATWLAYAVYAHPAAVLSTT